MLYKFTYRRRFFWKTIRISGHNYNKDMDKMVVYFPDGSLREIRRWKDCELKLGVDWYNQTLKQMETSIGTKIPTNVQDSK